jgi:ABC-type nitrate/sulfonate/bicarbonate transport system substrate-binding protein
MFRTKRGRSAAGFAHLGLLVLLALVVGICVLAFIRIRDAGQTAKQLQPVSLKLSWVNQAEYSGFYVAREKGYYAAEGLELNFNQYKDGDSVNDDIANGKADFGISLPLELIAARDRGLKIKAVAAIYQTSPYGFASKTSANIHTPADLKGKVLGSAGDNTVAKVTYAALMATAGINLEDATYKPVGFDALEVLKNNEADIVDIYTTDQTYAMKKSNETYNILRPDEFGFAIYGDLIATSDKMISQNPTEVRAFTKASLRGWQYVLDHPDEALQIVAKYADKPYKDDPAYEKHILDASIPLISPRGGNQVGVMNFIPWNRAYQGVKGAGLIQHNTHVQDVYTTAFLDY